MYALIKAKKFYWVLDKTKRISLTSTAKTTSIPETIAIIQYKEDRKPLFNLTYDDKYVNAKGLWKNTNIIITEVETLEEFDNLEKTHPELFI